MTYFQKSIKPFGFFHKSHGSTKSFFRASVKSKSILHHNNQEDKEKHSPLEKYHK